MYREDTAWGYGSGRGFTGEYGGFADENYQPWVNDLPNYQQQQSSYTPPTYTPPTYTPPPAQPTYTQPTYTAPTYTPPPSYATPNQPAVSQNWNTWQPPVYSASQYSPPTFNYSAPQYTAPSYNWENPSQSYGMQGMWKPTVDAAADPSGYNSQISGQMGSWLDQAYGIADKVKGMGYGGNAYDYQAAMGQIDNLVKNIGAYENDGDYWAVVNSLRNDVYKNSQAAQQTQANAGSYFNNFGQTLGSIWGEANSADLGGYNWKKALSYLDAYDDDLDKYSFAGDTYQTLKANRDKVYNFLQQKASEYDAAAGTRDTYDKKLREDLTNFLSGFNTNYADLNQFESMSPAIQQALMGFQTRMQNYDGPLAADFDDEFALLQQAGGLFQGLQGRYNTEKSRLDSLNSNYGNAVSSLLRNLSGISSRDGASMSMALADIDNLIARMGGEQTKLNWDRSGLMSQLDQARSRIGSLQSSYNSNLSGVRSQIEQALAGYGSVEEWDSQTMDMLDQLINGAASGASAFTGGGADELYGLIQNARNLSLEKRTNLNKARSSIENELAALLTPYQTGTKLGSIDEINAQRLKAQDYVSRVRKYGATNAQDELDALLQFLNGEETRLTKSQQQAIDRDLAQQNNTYMDRYGNVKTYGGVTSDPMSATTLAQLARKRKTDQMLSPYASSSFAAALGL